MYILKQAFLVQLQCCGWSVFFLFKAYFIHSNLVIHSFYQLLHLTQTQLLSSSDGELEYSGFSVGLSPSVAAPPLFDNSLSSGSN